MKPATITTQTIENYKHPWIALDIGTNRIYADQIAPGSFVYRGGCGGGFAPGGCETASCSFTLANFNGMNEGLPLGENQEIIVNVGYGDDPATAQYMKFATVYLASLARSRNVFNCICYDKLHEADKTTFTYTDLNSTVNGVIQAAAAAAGITIGQLPADGGSIPIVLTGDGEMTCRQAIAYALEISGNFGYCNQDGELVCRWFDYNSVRTYTDYQAAEYSEAIGYTGVQVGDVTQGIDPNYYVVSGNPFVTEDNKAAIASRLYGILVGSVFKPGSVGVLADPRLDPGDCITVPYYMPGGTTPTYIVPVASMTFKSSMVESISCSLATSDVIQDLRQTVSKKAENSVTREEMEKYVDEHGGGSGDYIETHSGIGYDTELNTATVHDLLKVHKKLKISADESYYDSGSYAGADLSQNIEIFRDRKDTVNNTVLRPIYACHKPSSDPTSDWQKPPVIVPFQVEIPDELTLWDYDSTKKMYSYVWGAFAAPSNLAIEHVSGSIGIICENPSVIGEYDTLRIDTGGYGISWHYYIMVVDGPVDTYYLNFVCEFPSAAILTQNRLIKANPTSLLTDAVPKIMLTGMVYCRDLNIIPES
jgi:hypothetical protein